MTKWDFEHRRKAIMNAVFAEAKHMDVTPDEPLWPYAVVIITAAIVQDSRPVELASLTQYSLDFIDRIVANMMASSLWQQGHVEFAEWEDKHTGRIAFILHLMIAMGDIERKVETGGRVLYRATDRLLRSKRTYEEMTYGSSKSH